MPFSWFHNRSLDALDQRRATGLLRSPRIFVAAEPTIVILEGRRLINFGANDYLGLAWHPEVQKAAILTQRWGSGASPLVTGRSEIHAELEATLAAWKGMDAALTFSSGYATNVSVIPALAIKGDTIFSDQMNHASLIDGCKLAKAKTIIYPHVDLAELERMLHKASLDRVPGQGVWLVLDSVFSMEGDASPIAAIADLARRYDAGVIIDEAHAVGVYGEKGVGLAVPSDFAGCELVTIGTCSKALGSIGGYVAASQTTIEYLRQFSRGYIYSTAMPAAAAAATAKAIELCQGMEEERVKLRAMSTRLRKCLIESGFETSGVDSPIVPVYTQEPNLAIALSAKLAASGFFVPAIRPPTVPAGRSLLRVSLSALHTDEQLDGLINALRQGL